MLANPRMRILIGETGSINIGDKLPLVNTVNNNGVTTQNVTFVNVGIILSFTPTILPNGEIILDINLEVSSVNDTINTGTMYPIKLAQLSFKPRCEYEMVKHRSLADYCVMKTVTSVKPSFFVNQQRY